MVLLPGTVVVVPRNPVQTTLAGLGYEVELIDLAAAEIPVALVALVVSCAFVIVKDNKLMKKYYGKSTDTKK